MLDTCSQNISLWHSLALSDVNTNYSHWWSRDESSPVEKSTLLIMFSL